MEQIDRVPKEFEPLKFGCILIDLILREDSTGLDMWSFLVVQSEQHVIYRLKASGGQGGPK